MLIKDWLKKSTVQLNIAGIGTARLDALILLEDILGKDRSYLLAHPEGELSDTQVGELAQLIERRAQHEPIAYIRGKTEFYGREFYIDSHVLEPRPESEAMIELLKELVVSRQSSVVSKKKTEDRRQRTEDNSLQVIDVGTGSGALAITAKLEVPNAKVMAIDIDPACIKVAQKNAKKLGAEVEFLEGELLGPIPNTKYQIPNTILANLPYVPDNFTINQAATNEPRHAIFGGPDGLDLYRRLFAQTAKLSQKPKYILTESLPFQHNALQDIARATGYRHQRSKDFIQVFKFEH